MRNGWTPPTSTPYGNPVLPSPCWTRRRGDRSGHGCDDADEGVVTAAAGNPALPARARAAALESALAAAS